MRLYPKKIHSLEELRQERLELKRAVREGSDIFSFGDKKLKKKGKKAQEAEVEDEVGGLDLGGILGSITGNKSALGMILSTGLPLVLEMIPRQTKIKYFRKFIGEFAEAYIGWKAVKLGYHLLHSFLKPAPKKKAA